MSISFFFYNCGQQANGDEVINYYGHDVGDIAFNSNLDNSDFVICDSTNIITRRNGLKYPGGYGVLLETYQNKLKHDMTFASFSGYIVIRFIVNCKRETDRYRISTMDADFTLQECPRGLQDQILNITKNLETWQLRSSKDSGIDFSKYLNLKIENGKIITILQ